MRRTRTGVPQLEEGYARIAQELLEAIARSNLTKEEHSILVVIISKTYGWDKKDDWISTSQFSMTTGIAPEHCSRAVGGLVRKGLVTRRFSGRKPILSIQKRYLRWTCLRPVLPVEKTKWRKRQSQPELAGKSQPELAGYKDTRTKTPVNNIKARVKTNEPSHHSTAMIDPRVRSVVEEHLGFCWNSSLLKIVNDLVAVHGVENFLLAEVEATKSAIPANGFLRYVETTLAEQAKTNYAWGKRLKRAPTNKPVDEETAFFETQPLYRVLADRLTFGSTYAFDAVKEYAPSYGINIEEFRALRETIPKDEQVALIRRFVTLTLHPRTPTVPADA